MDCHDPSVIAMAQVAKRSFEILRVDKCGTRPRRDQGLASATLPVPRYARMPAIVFVSAPDQGRLATPFEWAVFGCVQRPETQQIRPYPQPLRWHQAHSLFDQGRLANLPLSHLHACQIPQQSFCHAPLHDGIACGPPCARSNRLGCR